MIVSWLFKKTVIFSKFTDWTTIILIQHLSISTHTPNFFQPICSQSLFPPPAQEAIGHLSFSINFLFLDISYLNPLKSRVVSSSLPFPLCHPHNCSVESPVVCFPLPGVIQFVPLPFSLSIFLRNGIQLQSSIVQYNFFNNGAVLYVHCLVATWGFGALVIEKLDY